jgi:DNA-binding SARP family transcriptional activator
VDSNRFERLVIEGRGELVAGRHERALVALEAALSLWRGPPLSDFAYEQFAQAEIARLNDLRVAALEELVEAKLAGGRHAEVLGALEALIAEHPYRERLRAQLMLALYRGERQADALQAYHDARRTLVEHLGIEPGERLRALERAILAQAPELGIARRDQAAPATEIEAVLHDRVADVEDQLAELHERLGEPGQAASARSVADAERRKAAEERARRSPD